MLGSVRGPVGVQRTADIIGRDHLRRVRGQGGVPRVVRGVASNSIVLRVQLQGVGHHLHPLCEFPRHGNELRVAVSGREEAKFDGSSVAVGSNFRRVTVDHLQPLMAARNQIPKRAQRAA
jgi:hypothetical protein